MKEGKNEKYNKPQNSTLLCTSPGFPDIAVGHTSSSACSWCVWTMVPFIHVSLHDHFL